MSALLSSSEKLRVKALLHESGDVSPAFSGDQWLLPWLDIYLRAGDRSRVYWQTHGTGGVLAPLMIRGAKRRGVIIRELRFLGTGDDEEDEIATEYPDITCDGVAPDAAADMVADYLRQSRGWDVFLAEAVQEDSVLGKALDRCGGYRRESGLRYCLDLRSDFEDWLCHLGSSSRGKFRRTLRRIDETGLSLRLDLPANEGFEELSRLHQRRWEARGMRGVFSSPKFCEFHRRMLAERRLGAHLAGLYQGDLPLALWYGFDFGGVRYFYQGGFNPDRADGFSAGEALHLLMIRDAISRGLRCYDFMKGGADSWKARFGVSPQPLFDWALPGKSLRGAAVRVALHRAPDWQRSRGVA
ncbi:MAG: GNAT family N-acetyltransferase [Alcanivoracaceae bacterium]|nr:GNAT family N-acetyltransferase [Alcanivoracaceae bacterium]